MIILFSSCRDWLVHFWEESRACEVYGKTAGEFRNRDLGGVGACGGPLRS